MDLCSLHADIRMLSDRILCSEIPLKRMTTLMRDDVHITAGTVKVSEDKRCMVERQIGHVTASFLGLAAQYVKQLVLHHEIKKFRSLRGQLTVHLLACCHDLFRGAGGRRVAVLEIYLLVDIAELLQTQTLSSAVMQFFREGYKILFDLLTESLYLVLTIAVTIHTVIAQFQIILVTHGSGLCGTVLHQFVVNGIQLLLIFPEKVTHFLPCLSADIAVAIHQIGPQQGQVQFLAVKVDLGTGNQFIIFHSQGVLFLHQRDQRLAHRLLCQLHILECYRTDLLLQISSVGGFI